MATTRIWDKDNEHVLAFKRSVAGNQSCLPLVKYMLSSLIGLATYPKKIMTYTKDEIIIFTIDDFKEKIGTDFTEKDWKEYKSIIEKAMEDFIIEIKAVKNEN